MLTKEWALFTKTTTHWKTPKRVETLTLPRSKGSSIQSPEHKKGAEICMEALHPSARSHAHSNTGEGLLLVSVAE